MVQANYIITIDGQPTSIICSKFKAFECLSFITSVIHNLPAENDNFLLKKRGAEYLIMSVMDTAPLINLTNEEKENYPKLQENDFFAEVFKTAFINAEETQQREFTSKLLSLYTYNSQAMTPEVEFKVFTNAKILMGALLHAIRYNYNDFFTLDDY